MTISMDTLPFDVTEKILCSIGSPQDLRSLASTARSWAGLIIPRHIQYRTLRLGPGDRYSHSLWAHLAERKDLAKNIREVRLTGMSRKWERYPTTLVPSLEDQLENEEESSFLQAFRNFEKLENFTWSPHQCPGFMDPHRNPRFLEILTEAKHLSDLDLSQWENQANGTRELFSFEGLKRLHLRGLFWAAPALVAPTTSMLLRCPDIQDLSLYYNYVSPSFVKCFFPRLRILSIHGAFGTDQDDGSILEFIKTHDAIEELTWYPKLKTSPLPGSLPALRKITSNHGFIMNALEDTSVKNRALRRMSQICINSSSMKILEGIEGSQLQELYIAWCDETQNIHRLAGLFPTITTLEIPSSWEHAITIDDLIFTYSHFPALECIINTQIWELVLDLKGNEAQQAAVTKLARACPNLKSMTFYDLQQRMIMIHRDGEYITWEGASDDSEDY